ncbi:MAG TPA: DNA-deoxyinosine glycosylase [Lachnospiraceae bacterium]|nr:DNA-deoxyinosine glycosylase [Lachnospiraceae bacterium]
MGSESVPKHDGRKQEPAETVYHNIAPVYDKNSRILILGSFPSVKSREAAFFYHHPQNRFWRVLAAVTGKGLPYTIEEKRAFLLANHIAVWDVIASCTIHGSSDASIRDAKPNDLGKILDTASIKKICTNGSTSWKLYRKYQMPLTGLEPVRLPSTSPANAAWSLERLVEAWGKEIGSI